VLTPGGQGSFDSDKDLLLIKVKLDVKTSLPSVEKVHIAVILSFNSSDEAWCRSSDEIAFSMTAMEAWR
jgi:hypothetical protein